MDLYPLRLTPGLLGFGDWALFALCFFNEADK